MAWYDWAAPMVTLPTQGVNWLSGQAGGPTMGDGSPQGIWDWGKQRSTAPNMGQNPFMGDWGTLIKQLQMQAEGNGPSLAGDAYKQASQDAMSRQLALAHGSSAGGVRQAGTNMGMIDQGMAQGYSNARLQEQMAARQALMGALGGAGNTWFGANNANLGAQLQSPTNMQMLTSFLSQAGQIGGMAAGARTGGGGGGMYGPGGAGYIPGAGEPMTGAV